MQGYFLRHTNAYLAALALVTGPNAAGHLVGPVLTALGLWNASRDRSKGSPGAAGPGPDGAATPTAPKPEPG